MSYMSFMLSSKSSVGELDHTIRNMCVNKYRLCNSIFILILLFTHVIQAAIIDSRCYLDGGGSAESFLASEDLKVGAIIGKLRINGDPDLENGNINLSLRERISPVQIIPGTKTLSLTTALDKEGVSGPSSIYVNVICVRRHSTDPSFVIPVNVRVIDVNDNAPYWIGTPYTLTLSEVTVPGTRILQGTKAEDADQPGPFSTIEYQVLPGLYSEYVQFLNPLEGTLVLRKALDYETMHNFTVKLRAQDQGRPPKYSDTLLTVIITDADDQNPKFARETYRADLPSDGRPGELRIRPEPIKAQDQDEDIGAPIQYTIIQSQDSKFFRIHPHSGTITLLSGIGYADLTNGATLVVKATQIDNPDRYALATVVLNKPNSNRNDLSALAFVQKKFYMRIREDTAVGNRILALPTNKPDKHLKYFIPDPVNSQFFNVGSLGEVILIKPLDYEKMTRHDFQVYATDGASNTTAEIALEVTDVNDWEPRFRETHYEFLVPKSQTTHLNVESLDGMMIGKIEAADGDRNDKLKLSLRGQYANHFEIDNNGNLYMRPEQIRNLNESTIHLIAVATDSGVPPRSASVGVTVTLEGVALNYAKWSNNIVGLFGVIVAVSIIIIFALSCYIFHFKGKTQKNGTRSRSRSRNKVHTHNQESNSAKSCVNMVTHEKLPSSGNNSTTPNANLAVLHMKNNGNITMANPFNKSSSYCNSPMGRCAPTTIAATSASLLERERDWQKENYAATVRNIISRASVNGQLSDEEIVSDTVTPNRNQVYIKEGATHKKNAWENSANGNSQAMRSNNITTISCVNGAVSNGLEENVGSTNLVTQTDVAGSSENNLTVYF